MVVRAGRPDVQISALQSETTRAMVLTGGEKPIDYVFYEARTKRIPLIMVDGDTNATMDALDALAPEGFSHPEKLSRVSQLTVRTFDDRSDIGSRCSYQRLAEKRATGGSACPRRAKRICTGITAPFCRRILLGQRKTRLRFCCRISSQE